MLDQRQLSIQELAPAGQAEARAFLCSLVRELFQTEQSAKTHPAVEAERLGDVPPASALRAVAAHAEDVLAELPALMRVRGLPVSAGGRLVGTTFSVLRDHLADLLLTSERSYRGTLLGMRHGVDLVELLRHTAATEGDPLLAAWCARWLDQRRPLVEAATGELAWFAARPQRAAAPAKSCLAARIIHKVLNSIDLVDKALRHHTPREAAPRAAASSRSPRAQALSQ